MAKLEVTHVKRHLMGSRVTVYASSRAEALFGSFMGDRLFYLKKGYELTLLVKGKDWEVGETLSMKSLVGYAWDWTDIPWRWE